MIAWFFSLLTFADQKSERRLVQSKALDKPMHITTIWSNESHTDQGYMVVLMLHGLGDDDQGFLGNRLYFAEAEIPMIVISPQGDRGYWTDGDAGNYASWALEAVELERQRLGLSREPCRTAIAGVSMGGFGALSIGLQHPEIFSLIAPLSPTDLELAIEDIAPAGPMRLLYTDVWGEPLDMEAVRAVNPIRLLEDGKGKEQYFAYVVGEKESRKFRQGAVKIHHHAQKESLQFELRVVPEAGHSWHPTWGAQSTRWWIEELGGKIGGGCAL